MSTSNAAFEDSIDMPFSIEFPCIKVSQPLGDFFVASIPYKQLVQITYSDVRRLSGDREIDTYLGIQREVDKARVTELRKYVGTVDACFPTAVILAISEDCAEFDADRNLLRLTSFHDSNGNVIVNRTEIAKVLDGQHRIEGLKGLSGGVFDMNVSIFIDMDIASQAYLFSVVNLAQTKVKKSLVYDLFEYARARSPQKCAHNIAVALDSLEASPLYRRIKRLGSATPGRRGETLTQATFVEALIDHISSDAVVDRDIYMRGRQPAKPSDQEKTDRIFRELFLNEQDMVIADVLLAYFSAIRNRWPVAWSNPSQGFMLARSSGFRGLMRLLAPCVKKLRAKNKPLNIEMFAELFAKSSLNDNDFVVTQFLPGSGGEARLFKLLESEMLDGQMRLA